jgi:hypothetical protein
MIIFTAARHVGYTLENNQHVRASVAALIHHGELAETTVRYLGIAQRCLL